jgi:hypothetical protein
MKKNVKSFAQFIRESLDIDDPRNSDQDPQAVIDSVLEIWIDSSADEKTSELIRRYEMAGFRVLTLSQISDEQDIPSGSVVFTYHDDPADLCYYKQGSEMFEVVMGHLDQNNQEDIWFLDREEYGGLEEMLGVEFGNDYSYDDVIIAVSPA